MECVKGVLLLAGTGRRFGWEMPKQFVHVGGKPLYAYALETLLSIDVFQEIIVVCHPDWMIEPAPRLRVVEGGATRRDSSYRGLLACGDATDIVVIHDGARPFVSEQLIRDHIEAAIRYGAVDTCIPSADTIVTSRDGTSIDDIPDRNALLRGQTPQSFSYPLIRKAHEEHPESVTDDCSLALKLGHPIHILEGSESNIKITTELDLSLAEQVLQRRLPATHHGPCTSLEGKRYAVIGGYGGIGAPLVSAIEEAGGEAISLSRQSGFDVRRNSVAELGPLDGLIYAAGLLVSGEIIRLSSADIEEQIAVNLTGLIRCCNEADIAPGGHLIAIASSAFSRGRKGYAVYSAAKAGVVNFMQAVAEERPDLCVSCVIPARTDTPMRRAHFEGDSLLLQPEDVADRILSIILEGKPKPTEHVRLTS